MDKCTRNSSYFYEYRALMAPLSSSLSRLEMRLLGVSSCFQVSDSLMMWSAPPLPPRVFAMAAVWNVCEPGSCPYSSLSASDPLCHFGAKYRDKPCPKAKVLREGEPLRIADLTIFPQTPSNSTAGHSQSFAHPYTTPFRNASRPAL